MRSTDPLPPDPPKEPSNMFEVLSTEGSTSSGNVEPVEEGHEGETTVTQQRQTEEGTKELETVPVVAEAPNSITSHEGEVLRRSTPPVEELPDLNLIPCSKEKIIESNRMEKQKQREKKREQKWESRRKTAERFKRIQFTNTTGENASRAGTDLSSEDEMPSTSRFWKTAGGKKLRGETVVMETEGGLQTGNSLLEILRTGDAQPS
ncbi:hypothetical protein R1flu_019218 [Riccia fluitans]|uniref:Uncharacterized protein n=1 Tax=Riccia fluitans TaxID=41844 RepID=A0ABD1ZI26_9MARC